MDDRSDGGSTSGAGEDRLLRALELMIEELREQVDRDPWAGREELRRPLRLSLQLEGHRDREGLRRQAEGLRRALRQELAARRGDRAALEPGRVFCLRCGSARCEHSMPASPAAIFSGYGPTGVPDWRELGQYLLERRDPRVDQLFEGRRVTHVTEGGDLALRLLPVFRDRERDYRQLGQVVAGMYRLPARSGGETAVAASFQAVAVRREGGPWRLALNVVAGTPEGESLESWTSAEELPWSEPVRWARKALEELERAWNSRRRRSRAALRQRAQGILEGLARRLERQERSKSRRTRHAEDRRRQDRPVPAALADLDAASEERLFVDERAQTLVVVGARGRAHVFNPQGRLVTSMRLEPGAVDRRRRSGRWRPGSSSELSELRRAVAEHASRDDEPAGPGR